MGQLYEELLDRAYILVSRAYGAHEPHPTAALTPSASALPPPCPACGHQDTAGLGTPAGICGGPNPTDRCDALGDLLFPAVETVFPDGDEDLARRLLADTPEAWTWGTSDFAYDSITDYVISTFRVDAHERLALEGPVSIPRKPRDDDACPADPDGLHHVGCGCDVDHFDTP